MAGLKQKISLDLIKVINCPMPHKDLKQRNEYSREWVQKNPEKRRNTQKKYRLSSKYGLTVEQEKEMLEQQKGKCACCEERRAKVVDHDHETGAVRGILCIQCNTILGYAGDSVAILKKAARFLESSRRVHDK